MTLLTRIAHSNGNPYRKKVALQLLKARRRQKLKRGMKGAAKSRLSLSSPQVGRNGSNTQAGAPVKHQGFPRDVPHRWILIVDDADYMRKILKTFVSFIAPDYQVVTAVDGLTALKRFQEQTFDLVVTDYNMPLINGMDLIVMIRRQAPTIPVILITAAASLPLRQTAEQMDKVSILEKPFSLAQLETTFNHYFRKVA